MSTTKVTEILTSLEETGRLTAPAVVDLARSPNSPLHDFFEWDDTVAAELHRQAQARTLIRSIKIRVETKTIHFTVPAFVSDPEIAGYVSIKRLAGDEDRARDVVVAEFSRAASALNRAKAISEVLGVGAEVKALHHAVQALSERVEGSRIENS